MTKIKIEYDQNSCIGAAECEAISPDLWKVNRDGKAELKNAVLNKKTGMHELILEDNKELQKKVAGSCPIGCIRISKV